ncbi:hypothetical protein ACI01nite_06660 [Acetobacter cibinongensis]|uniref:Uncharacterized protein n=1 Tax=Acetobacter cibinongensis TaxID=146475 RepID=A0A0D6N3U3_9PROT|nr:hypothetical protein Abci_011_090 [Acetobacter cibinongensis]GEL58064.1 hypothetical protein ACI01nite_06660 [Acetobacter cibinongensis]
MSREFTKNITVEPPKNCRNVMSVTLWFIKALGVEYANQGQGRKTENTGVLQQGCPVWGCAILRRAEALLCGHVLDCHGCKHGSRE